jgi:hypothetical protein
MNSPAPRCIPLWQKVAYTAFMAVLVPVYWAHYGPTNFLYFCDVALLLTLAGIWKESALLISLACVGILLPQALWCVDFVVVLCGGRLTGMTNYMVSDSPLFLRGLSLFHGWLPFLLVFLVLRTGYDQRALRIWTPLAWLLCLAAFFCLPGPYEPHPGDLTPKNVNMVFGMSDTEPQQWMSPGLYLACWMAALTLVVYWPTHLALRRWVGGRKCSVHSAQCSVEAESNHSN